MNISYFYKKQFITLSLVVFFVVNGYASDNVYLDYKNLFNSFQNIIFGGNQNKFPVFDMDGEYEEVTSFTCEQIHIDVDIVSYNFIDDLILSVKNSIDKFGLNNLFEEYYKKTIFNLDIRPLIDSYPDNHSDCIRLEPMGSYVITAVAHKEPSMNSTFIFERYGLKFSSYKFLYPIYRRIKRWYISDTCADLITFPFIQWSFKVLCGKIISAKLYIEYSGVDIIEIDIITDKFIQCQR